MKTKIIKIVTILTLIMFAFGIAMPTICYGRAHSSARSSVSSSVKASTPKTRTSSSSTVKASTPKSTTSKITGKTYTTTKNSAGRTVINHDTVPVKNGTTNNKPVFYSTYRTDYTYPITNSIFSFYLLHEIFSDKENVTEQDIAKALEEKGYTQEEVNQILDEAQQEEEENKPLFDGWKWYNWVLLVAVILLLIGLTIMVICLI